MNQVKSLISNESLGVQELKEIMDSLEQRVRVLEMDSIVDSAVQTFKPNLSEIVLRAEPDLPNGLQDKFVVVIGNECLCIPRSALCKFPQSVFSKPSQPLFWFKDSNSQDLQFIKSVLVDKILPDMKPEEIRPLALKFGLYALLDPTVIKEPCNINQWAKVTFDSTSDRGQQNHRNVFRSVLEPARSIENEWWSPFQSESFKLSFGRVKVLITDVVFDLCKVNGLGDQYNYFKLNVYVGDKKQFIGWASGVNDDKTVHLNLEAMTSLESDFLFEFVRIAEHPFNIRIANLTLFGKAVIPFDQ